jgi:hypothetical protein
MAIGCGHEMSGPRPKVEGIDPELICTEQLSTTITIAGSSLSPLTADSATSDPELKLPKVTLQPSQTLVGQPASQDATGVPIPVDLVSWTSQRSMTFETNPALGLQPGVYDIVVQNANGNSVSFTDGLVAVPPPELHSVAPDLLCTAQGTNSLTLSGAYFLRAGDTMPQVNFGPDISFSATSMSGCTPLAGPVEDAELCDTLTLEVPQGGIPVGAHDVRVVNPMPAGCASSETVTVAVVPPPSVETIEPDLICNEQHENVLTVTGAGFLDVEGSLPTVTIGDQTFTADSISGCADVEGTLLSASSCDILTVTVPTEALPTGALDVVVTNPEPAACVSEEAVTLASVPPPILEGVDPEVVCLDEAEMTLTLSGQGFLDVEGALPTITVDGTDIVATAVSDCTPVAGTLLEVQSCATLTVDLPQGSLAAGTYSLVVNNPPPADCVSTEEVTFAVVNSPAVLTVEPDLICNAQGNDTITIGGNDFLDIDGALPTVNVGGESFSASSVSDCQPVAGTTNTLSCASLTVEISEGSLTAGEHELTVTNPPPAACTSPPGPNLFVAPPPVITSSLTDPPCTPNPTALTIDGSGFLVVDSTQPIVLVNSTEVTITAISGCTDFTGPSLTTQICTTISVDLPTGLLSTGAYQLEVINPPPAGCSGTFDSAIGLPPTIDSINPIRICETGGEITVNGSNFLDGAQVTIDGTPADYTNFVSANQLVAGVPAGLPGGQYDITVQNPDGCTATLPDALQIVELPLIYYVDPPVVYNGINTQVTIFASGIAGNVVEVRLRPTGQTGPLTILDFNFDPNHANRIQAIIPAGQTPAVYDVIVEDDVGCVAELGEGVTVTDTLTVALQRIIPPFGWTDAETPVSIYAEETVDPTEVQFVATPRAYLNPANPDPNTVATAIDSVAFVDPLRLNGVVPEELPVGLYDLIVVNPTGEVGLLSAAFEVTAEAPPIVDSISPSSVVNQGGQNVDMAGSNFRNPVVFGTCRAPDDTEYAITGTINGSTDSSIDVTFDMSGVPEGSACVLRVENDDGTFFDFSAMSVTNPAKNLTDFDAQPAMSIGRRAPAGTAGRPTRTARFLYVMGGDDGDNPYTAYSSVETAPVDLFGELGTWFDQPYSLPGPRTHAKATTIGRYIYLVGGNDTISATSSVLRAEILQPSDAPDITDVDIQLAEGTGLGGGTWYYRVSAVFPSTDPRNPNGESLASDPLIIRIPDRPERIHVTLVWSQVAGAAGYRIYRSPTPNLTSGSERLIAEVTANPLVYIDEGDTAGTTAPLPFGATGTWKPLPSLTVPRESMGLAAAVDPDDASTFYIYALGGRDDTQTALASYEYLTVTLQPGGGQAVSTWTMGAQDMPAARWQLSGFVADHTHASIVPSGDIWIYAGGGVASNGTTMVPSVDAALVQTGGDLGTWQHVSNMTPGRAGYGSTLANSTLYVFGGPNATPSTEGASAEIVGPPGLAVNSWNNLGLSMSEARYLPASTTESAFIFVIGGWNGTAATSSVDKTIW